MILTKIHPNADISLVHCRLSEESIYCLARSSYKMSMETEQLIRDAILNGAFPVLCSS